MRYSQHHGLEGLCSLEGDDLLPLPPQKSTDWCPVGGCFECSTRYDKHMATMTDSLRQVHSSCYFRRLECPTPLAEPLYESQFCYMDDSDGCRRKYQFGFYVGQAPAFLIVLCFFLNMYVARMGATCTPRHPFASGCDLYELKSLD